MRFLLVLCCFVSFALPVYAQDDLEALLNGEEPKAAETIEIYAQRYLTSCQEQEHFALKGQSLAAYCRCSAREIPEIMTLQDIHAIETGGNEGTFQLARMMLLVYSPCLQTPLRSEIYGRCMSSVENKYTMSNQRAHCVCRADGISEDMANDAPKTIEYALQQGFDDENPLDILIDQKTYQNRWRYHYQKCERLFR